MKKIKTSFVERIGNKIPDPVILFILFYIIVLTASGIFGGTKFETIGYSGDKVEYEIRQMFTAENIRWIFQNAILKNWLSYAGGIIGTILIVMFGIGVAEESGFLGTLIKKIGVNISDKYLPFVLVFLGIMSNIATDAGYIILVPLAGMLYMGLGKNPLIGMAAAFAGVSAGFSANLIPASVVDVVIGTNAKGFAESQGIPFVSYLGKDLNPMTMHYYFMAVSTLFLVTIGGIVTTKLIRPKLEKQSFSLPEDMERASFEITAKENKALRWGGAGFLLSLIILALLAVFPLRVYVDETGDKITPFLDNIVLLITFVFFLSGAFFGFASGRFKKISDLVGAMAKQVGSMGYVIVLTFFCYNFLALLTYTNIGNYITYAGAGLLQRLGFSNAPILLIISFVLITAIINLFVGGLSSKWMLLGPIFIPMLYNVNTSMTPDVVAAAYRVADSATNTITPLMTYAGVVLVYMRKYKPKMNVGGLISLMMPYSISFLVAWTILLIGFIIFKIPLGF